METPQLNPRKLGLAFDAYAFFRMSPEDKLATQQRLSDDNGGRFDMLPSDFDLEQKLPGITTHKVFSLRD